MSPQHDLETWRRGAATAPGTAPAKTLAAGGPGATFYGESAGDDWRECEIIAARSDGLLILRELGKPLPGVWLASRAQVRVLVGTLEAPEIVRRNYLPKEATASQLHTYRKIREVASREVALRLVFGSP